MKRTSFLAIAFLFATTALAQVGRPLPEHGLEDFGQTKAKSLDDFVGRTLIIEFFAYW